MKQANNLYKLVNKLQKLEHFRTMLLRVKEWGKL